MKFTMKLTALKIFFLLFYAPISVPSPPPPSTSPIFPLPHSPFILQMDLGNQQSL